MLTISQALATVVFAVRFLPTTSWSRSDSCLASPPSISHSPSGDNDVAWEIIGNGVYATTLTFDAKTFEKDTDNVPCTFRTRVHNDMFPSPTLHFRPGNQYQISLINNLGPESPLNPSGFNLAFNNSHKDPNTTNIHTHGLHISGLSPGDSIFTTAYPQTSNITYIYNIPCNHFSGTFWYHPHHHGSATLQVAGGAGGALIMEQESDALYELIENLPQWLISMEELIIVIQYFNLPYISSIFEYDEIDLVTSYTRRGCETAKFYTLNGQYHPTICLNAKTWKRLRLVNTHYHEPVTLYLNVSTNDTNASDTNLNYCELKLIARDGIFLENGPRSVSHLWLAQAQRADVVILCHNFVSNLDSYTIEINDGNGEIYGFIKVSGSDLDVSESDSISLSTFVPNRPNYIQNLMNYDGQFQQYDTGFEVNGAKVFSSSFSVRVSGDRINLDQFSGQGHYLTNLEVGSVNEWNINSGIAVLHHPFHLHIYPFQVVSGGFNASYTGQDIPSNWHQVGDYVDIMYGMGTIRFVAANFGGEVILHCHILKHEDAGAMAVVEVFGGCDAHYDDYVSPNGNGTYETCQYYTNIEPECEAIRSIRLNTTNTTNTPTQQPSIEPTDEPTHEPTDVPTIEFDYNEDACCHTQEFDDSDEITCNLMVRSNLCENNGCSWNYESDNDNGSCVSSKGTSTRRCRVYSQCKRACEAQNKCQWEA